MATFSNKRKGLRSGALWPAMRVSGWAFGEG